MRWLDGLRRGVRVFRITTPMDGLTAELRGIRLALEVICREQYSIELAPERSVVILPGEDESYTEDGGPPDLEKVAEMLRDTYGWVPPTDEERADPIGATDANLASEPEEWPNDPYRDRIPTARRASAFDRAADVQADPDDHEAEDS